ncbi:MAG TPA: hypothetical protein PLR43_03225 [Syntrophales bacterium]|nr:hypothetical protein [Syntrophales bacterium]
MSKNPLMPYVQDAPFWYLLAGEVLRRGEGALAPLFQKLTDRAGELGLPIVYQGRKSLYWAVAGRLYLYYEFRVPDLDRPGFRHMIRGLQCAFTPPVFAQAAIGRILANIASPSSPNRSVAETVADTFMANGMSVTEDYGGTESDGWILKACLGDETIMALSTQAVTPPEGLWDQVAAFYGENRPGWYYRLFPGKIKALPKLAE